MSLRIAHAARRDAGRVRETNEDAWHADAEGGLFLVSDGMGGARSGEVAAGAVAAVLPPMIQEKLQDADDLASPAAKESFGDALCELSDRIRAETAGEPGLEGMGATVAVLLIRGDRAIIGHMGDSRVYLLRGAMLERLTRDHSIAQILVDAGEITPAQAKDHPGARQLSRYVGMAGAALPDVRALDLRAGDVVLLCTDGLTAAVPDERIADLLQRDATLDAACDSLVEAANDAGGDDNITVLLVRVEEA